MATKGYEWIHGKHEDLCVMWKQPLESIHHGRGMEQPSRHNYLTI